MSSDSPKSLSDILAASGSALRDLVTDAYSSGHEAGFDAGYKAAVLRFSEALRSVSEPPQEGPEDDVKIIGDFEPTIRELKVQVDAEVRATPGTVKPTIEKIVRESSGVTMQEIVEKTGFKFNSVRGTLYTLKSEGVVDKWGEQWFPFGQTPQQELPPQAKADSRPMSEEE